MIPLGDNVAGQQRPVVTQVLMVACVAVFAYELTLRGAALDQFVQTWGAVPSEILAALRGDPRVPRSELFTLVTSQFLHAGFLHLGGNLLFLWVFGRAIEERLGHVVFLLFYVLAGVLAGVVQSIVSGPADTVPLVGASGAIAGVLGLYFIAYPTAWVRVLLPVLFFFWAFDLPALVVLGFWFVTQFFTGLAAITQASSATGDVAIWAHVAGFVVGAACAFVLPAREVGHARGAGAAAFRRSDAPGPARLISSLADLAALLLVARVVVVLLGLDRRASPLAVLATPVVSVTEPVVDPLNHWLPTVSLMGGSLETAALLTIVLVYLVAGLLGQLFLRT